jgi:phosphopantetheine--protein transferase-like protein
MTSNEKLDQILTFLSRYINRDLGADDVVTLTSVQRAVVFSWLERQGVQHAAVVLQSQAFSPRQLLGVEDVPKSMAAHMERASSVTRSSSDNVARGLFNGIGIDIAHVKNLPIATDYRDHEFYGTHFATSEIVYCIQAPNARESFCGLWAAKEAIVKAKGISRPNMSLSEIVISHDEFGCPSHPGVAVSISHNEGTAIAVAAMFSTERDQKKANVTLTAPLSGTAESIAIPKKSLVMHLSTMAAAFVMAAGFCYAVWHLSEVALGAIFRRF